METQWVFNQYSILANHPMYSSRKEEYAVLKQLAEHYGFELSMEDFDAGIAKRFGHGCEYKWSRD